MRRLSITTKIWISIGVFATGFILTTVLGQIQGLRTENTLRNTSEALFPAAQQSQESEAAFHRAAKCFSDAVLLQDASALEQASEEGRRVVELLKALATVRGLTATHTDEVRSLASAIEQFLGEARNTYATVIANPASMTGDTQARMQDLAARSDALKAGLQKAKESFAADLKTQLSGVVQQSEGQRWLELALFTVTLAVAAVIVNLTIRRAITRPILRVIDGLRRAADEATHASERLAESGQGVAHDAQQQASYIQETSASLEEISATTRENAARAGQADRLMEESRRSVTEAVAAMNDLKNSMAEIDTSSKQVSAVLKSIDEIAFHTNILALNAAVEAARAGEAGAGFSVVADEVRSLAQRAADAAKRSAEIIEKTIHDVSHGVQLVSVADSAFQQVSNGIATGSRVVTEIAGSSEEQARGVGHIGEAITRIERVTQNNAANAHETAETAAAMRVQVQTTRAHLDELVAVVGLQRQ